MLVRAFGYDNPDGTDFFVDHGDSVFEESVNKLVHHRVTLGCNPPDNDRFCPYSTLTRAEMASFFTGLWTYSGIGSDSASPAIRVLAWPDLDKPTVDGPCDHRVRPGFYCGPRPVELIRLARS
jgi:hypothetical protein